MTCNKECLSQTQSNHPPSLVCTGRPNMHRVEPWYCLEPSKCGSTTPKTFEAEIQDGHERGPTTYHATHTHTG
jgi:hypothetical protein